jgi:hypothetical protein
MVFAFAESFLRYEVRYFLKFLHVMLKEDPIQFIHLDVRAVRDIGSRSRSVETQRIRRLRKRDQVRTHNLAHCFLFFSLSGRASSTICLLPCDFSGAPACGLFFGADRYSPFSLSMFVILPSASRPDAQVHLLCQHACEVCKEQVFVLCVALHPGSELWIFQ